MRRITCAVLTFVTVLPLAACKSKQAVCEHARDRVVELSELDARMVEHDASDDQKASAREFGEQITTATRDGFVAPCLELDEAERKCMAEIDGFADAMIAAQQGLLDCSPESGGCDKWSKAMDEARAGYGDACVKVVDRVSSMAMANLELR